MNANTITPTPYNITDAPCIIPKDNSTEESEGYTQFLQTYSIQLNNIMNPNDRNSNESVRIADEVDENLVQEIPSPHIQMNENEAELHPHYNVAYGHN